ncbi:MAG: germination protein YpeB [Clostridia bacterium]|nr:germination protein YpeB [Clostridia bacterium]
MHNKLKRRFIRVISFLSVAVIMLSVSTALYASKAKKYQFANEVVYQRSMNELCESLDNISVSLQKGIYCGTKEKLLSIGNELTREAACAKMSLSQLTDEDLVSEEIYKFLSQIGAFTLSLASGDDKLTVSANDSESLAALLEYSKALSSSVNEVVGSYGDGTVALEVSESTLSLDGKELPKSLSSSLIDAEQSLTDYPTLIYDGPFADSILNRKGGESLEGLSEITKEEARQKAADIIGTPAESLRQEQDNESKVPLYCFSKGDISIGITKKGGKISYIINPASPGEETISTKEAVKRAKEYLQKHGYNSMKESYYSVYDGICTVNFAYVNEGIIHYSDLIKVSVALDSAEVTALDAGGYLVNHCKRNIYDVKVTEEEAIEKISPALSVTGTKSAVIPLDSGKEAYCYEFHCKDKDGQEVLIYIDKKTGEEREVLLLLYADGGTLTR